MVTSICLSMALLQTGVQTWEFRASEWEDIVPRLSQALGRPVQVINTIKDEVVIGRFIDKSPEDMARKFAQATMTTWNDEEGVLVIRPDGKAREADRKAKLQKKIDALQASLNTYFEVDFSEAKFNQAVDLALDAGRRRVADPESFPALEGEMWSRHGLQTRFLAEIIKSIGVDKFTDLPPAKIYTYSTNPTEFQYSLGSKGTEMLKSWPSRVERVRRALQDRNVDERSKEVQWIGALRLPANTVAPTELNVSVMSVTSSVIVFMDFLDERGKRLDTASIRLDLGGDPRWVEYSEGVTDEKSPLIEELQKLNQKVEFTDSDKLVGRVVNLGFDGRPSPLTKDQRAEMVAQFVKDELEPRSLATTSLLFEYSKARSVDVAGLLGTGWFWTVYGGSKKTNAVLGDVLLNYVNGMASEEDFKPRDGVFRPDQLPSPGEEIDMELVKKFTKLYALDRSPSLEDLSKLVSGAKSNSEFNTANSLAYQFVNALSFPSTIGREFGPGSDLYSMLVIFGGLPSNFQAQAAAGPVRVNIASLSSSARQYVLGMFTTSSSAMPLNPLLTEGQKSAATHLDSELKSQFGIKMERPSFYYALPEFSPFVLEVRRERIEAIEAEFFSPGRFIGTVDNLINLAAQMDKASLKERKYGEVSVEILSITYHAGPFHSTRAEIALPLTKPQDLKKLEELPEGVRSKIEQAIDRVNKTGGVGSPASLTAGN